MLWVLVAIVIVIVLAKLATRKKMENTQSIPSKSSAVSQLKTGDVLFFMSGDSPDVENLVLNSLVYTHIAIVYERGGVTYVVEVMPCKKGVVLTRAQELVDNYCGTVVVCHLAETRLRHRIFQKIEEVIDQLGPAQSRSMLEVLGVGLDSLMCRGSFTHSKIQWCSSLVYHILSETGAIPRLENGHCITPDELYHLLLNHEDCRLLKKLSPDDVCTADRPVLEVCGVRFI